VKKKGALRMDPALTVVEHRIGEVPVVAASGELDLATSPGLRELLEAHLDAGRSTIVVDLRAVTFLDSTALGVLVGALKRCRELNGDLRLVVTEQRTLKLFTITGLNEMFSIHASVEVATRSGSGRSGSGEPLAEREV
jgi:anti-sigma B factor antagonist